MKSLSLITILSLCLILVAGTALAERQVTVTRLAQEAQPLDITKDAPAACMMGNLNAPYYAITDWVWGAEAYKYMFYADQAECTCSAGFTVESVHIYLQFGPEDIPFDADGIEFDVYVDFEEALWDATLGCWVPGPEICVSPVYTVFIPGPGLYNISLPMTPGSCPCAYFGYWYGISYHFVTAFDGRPDLITDNVPVGCVSWNDFGMGWEDLQGYGLPGEISMYADIICCEDPVSTDSKTFGDLKALFR